MLGIGDVCDIHLVINEIGEDMLHHVGKGGRWTMDN